MVPAAVLLVAFGAPSGSGSEARPELVVLIARVDAGNVVDATALRAAMSKSAKRIMNARVLDEPEERQLNLDVEIARCRSEVRCLQVALYEAGVGLGLMTSVAGTDANRALVVVEMIHPKHDTIVESVLLDRDAILAKVNAASQHLVERSGRVLGATVTVEVVPAYAKVILDRGTPTSVAGATWLLAPGTYELLVEAEDHVSKRVTLTVDAAEIRQTLTLERIETIWASPWLWGGISVAVVAVITGASVLIVNSVDDEVRLCRRGSDVAAECL